VTQAYAPIATSLQQQERDRQLQAAQALTPLQDRMDTRRMDAITALGGVGAAFEEQARQQLQDQIARFQFGQQAPIQALQDYAGLITPISSGLPISVTNAPSQQASPLAGAFGGAIAGSALPASFLGGYGTLIGAGLGGLGLI
jgi:hypothetical protein